MAPPVLPKTTYFNVRCLSKHNLLFRSEILILQLFNAICNLGDIDIIKNYTFTTESLPFCTPTSFSSSNFITERAR